jgi:uncharacterized protein YjiS (DUF1127 family)
MTGSGRGPSRKWNGKDMTMADTVYYGFGRTESAGFSGLWARLGKALADYRLYRQTLDELAALSDRELADLGLSRLQVREVAYESVYGA